MAWIVVLAVTVIRRSLGHVTVEKGVAETEVAQTRAIARGEGLRRKRRDASKVGDRVASHLVPYLQWRAIPPAYATSRPLTHTLTCDGCRAITLPRRPTPPSASGRRPRTGAKRCCRSVFEGMEVRIQAAMLVGVADEAAGWAPAAPSDIVGWPWIRRGRPEPGGLPAWRPSRRDRRTPRAQRPAQPATGRASRAVR